MTTDSPSLSTERILITGASGNVGLETMRTLMGHANKAQFELIAGARNETDLNGKFAETPPNSIVTLDFTNAHTFGAALAGVSRVLLVRPPQLADVDRYFKPFVDAMKQAGVRHVVFLSLQGVENNPVTPHHKIEKLIVESGLPFTFLRPSFFMQNLSTTHRDEIRLRNEIFIPAGKGRTSFVDVRDVAAVAALALTDSTGKHLHRSYELTSSEALTYGEVAQILTTVTHRKITYRNPSVLRFIWKNWVNEKKPLGLTLVMTVLYTVAKAGKAAKLTKDTAKLLDRPPITFRQFAIDYQDVWMP